MTFDPYHAWLGISPREQPADYYRLLGVARFEPDAARIAAAADERLRLVASFQGGPWGMYTQPLLNELSAAKACLLNPAARYSYDAALRQARQSPPAGAYAAPAPAAYGPNYYAPRPGFPAAGPPPAPPPVAQRPAPKAAAAKPAQPDQPPPEPAAPAPWWRPVVAILAVALVLLASAAGWGIYQALHWNDEELAGPVEGPPEGESPEPQPEPPVEAPVLLQEGSGEVNFPAALATLGGGVEVRTLVAEDVLENWAAPEAAAQWDFRLVTPGFFQIELVYATQEGAVGAELEATIGPQHKRCELRPTGGRDKFLTDSYTIAVPSSGRHTLTLVPGRHSPGDWLILRSVRLIPVARNAVPPAATP